jgi:hypothetical protein
LTSGGTAYIESGKVSAPHPLASAQERTDDEQGACAFPVEADLGSSHAQLPMTDER